VISAFRTADSVLALDVLNPELSLALRAFIVSVRPSVAKTLVSQLEKIHHTLNRGLKDIVLLASLIQIRRQKPKNTVSENQQRSDLQSVSYPEKRKEKSG
jgi:hypothetical protein